MAKFYIEEEVIFTDVRVFKDNKEHYFHCKCYDGIAECTNLDETEKVKNIVVTYPTRKEIVSSDRKSDAVLQYRGLYDLAKKDITYGDIMMKYGVIKYTGIK